MSRLTHAAAGRYAPPAARRELVAVSADGARLHVEEHGDPDAPPVVLAHGWTCSTAFWAAPIRDLAADHRVIAYDQRGHGRTPATSRYSTTVLADDLAAVLRAALAPGERAVLAGHSMGGMTIMAAAGRPELDEHAAAVLLCSTGSSRLAAEARVVPLRPGRLRTRLTRALLGSRAPLGPVTPPARQVLKYATMGPGSAPDKVEACARIVHACPTAVRHGWSRVLAELDVDAQLAALTAPTAVLGGTADRLSPIVHARRLAAALPRCVGLIELAGMGHMTPVEAPEAVAGAVRDLARRHLADHPQETRQQQEERTP
ncbi:Putative aminoacrylate hydrolase RutD [Streptomyces sp. enrichment culture]|uniref:alpha/beta fold hydrolase n=1 Tax=Streptomyces TaxID=1883 RepID=UPI001674BCFA|nr:MULTISPECIES: alpha/beta hydrolase [Streptomyces]MBD3580752.1 alpha/beta hydrolase [Streptomyces sp. KD18]GGT08371.1 hydrolase [Streptomyces toxytricini]